MVLIALAIVFAGLGAMSLSSSDSDATGPEQSSTPATTAQPTTTTAASTTTASAGSTTTSGAATTSSTTSTAKPSTTAGVNRAVPVRVLNNSLVAGLAARTATELGASGWTIEEVGNFAGGTLAKTTVFYGNSPGEREAAQAIAAEIGGTAEPRGGASDTGSPGVTVVVTGN
jgi:hypothetical protein